MKEPVTAQTAPACMKQWALMHHNQISFGLAGSASFLRSRQFLPVAMYSPWRGKSMIACPMQRAKNTWKDAKSWCGGVSSSPCMLVKILSDREPGNLKINRKPTFQDLRMSEVAFMSARVSGSYRGGMGSSFTGWRLRRGGVRIFVVWLGRVGDGFAAGA